MTKAPSVSILLPTNTLAFIEEAIDSVMKQTFKDWKLLIGVNNYKTNPRLPEKIKDTLPPDPRIRLHPLKDCPKDGNEGIGDTLNELISLCETDYAAILDSDDLWLPEKLEKQVPLLDTYDVIGAPCLYFGSGLRPGMPNQPRLPLGAINPLNFFQQNPIINSSAIFRAADAKWDPSVPGVEDYEMWLRLNSEGKSFYNIPEILCLHRLHNTSSFNTKDISEPLTKIKTKWQITQKK